MRFITCSENTGYRGSNNSPVNLSLVQTFCKGEISYYPDNIGAKAIEFWFGADDSVKWSYSSEEARDEDYNRLLRMLL